MTAKHLLDQIERGLDGVTAGPYAARQEGANRWRVEIPREGYVPLSIALVCSTVLEVGCTDENTAANASHFSRCDPDTMREIAAYVRELEQSRDDYKSDYFRRHKDAGDHLDRATAAEATVTALQEKLMVAEDLKPIVLVEALKTVLASLVATTSLIIRAEDLKVKPSKAVASDKMFVQMLKDYDAATIFARTALTACDAPIDTQAIVDGFLAHHEASGAASHDR